MRQHLCSVYALGFRDFSFIEIISGNSPFLPFLLNDKQEREAKIA